MKPIYAYIIAGIAVFMAIKFYQENKKLKLAAGTAAVAAKK